MRVLKRIKERRGFSLAELLIVVAIIAILLAVAIPNVLSYYRELKITELDDDARTIFLAAQNQLTALSNSGEKLDGIGDKLKVAQRLGSGADAHPELRYVEYKAADASTTPTEPSATGLRKILPGGSVDTHFHKYNYVIEFDTESGAVYGVWYWEKDGFEYSTHGITKYQDKQSRLKDNVMVGFYGGDQIDRLQFSQLPYPTVQLINAEELRLVIGVPEIDGATEDFTITVSAGDVTLLENAKLSKGNKGTVVLDTLKVTNGYSKTLEEAKNVASTAGNWIVGMKYKAWRKELSELPLPGEDITLTVKMSYTDEIDGKSLTPSTLVVTGNTLFEKVEEDSTGNKTAYIAYGRHLQNLHDSGTRSTTGGVACSGVLDNTKITKAIQTQDINFALVNPGSDDDDVYYWASIYKNKTPGAAEDPYISLHPINNNHLTEYDGGNFEIRNMDTGRYLYGGLFSCISSNCTLKDITLVNAHIHADYDSDVVVDPSLSTYALSAGSFVGYIGNPQTNSGTANVRLENCHAYYDYNDEKDPIKLNDLTTLNLNGLKIEKRTYDSEGNETTPADAYVTRLMQLPHIGAPASTSISGGLIGQIADDCTVTIEGSSASVINIGAKAVGGLVGQSAGTLTIDKSYSASFVFGNRNVAGLVGLVTNTSDTTIIENSYAAGEIVGGYNKGFKGAGLLHYDGEAKVTVKPGTITVENCYAAVRYNGDGVDGLPRYDDYENKESFQVVGYIYGTFKGDNSNLYVRQNGISYGYDIKGSTFPGGKGGEYITDKGDASACGTAITTAELAAKVKEDDFGSDNAWNTGSGVTNAASDTHAYTLLNETKELKGEAYPYPMLKTLTGPGPHYGDWLEEDAATFALAYWERYEDVGGVAQNGVYGLKPNEGLTASADIINTLRNPGSVRTGKNYAIADGYGVLVKRDGTADTSAPSVTINSTLIDFTTSGTIIRDIDVNGDKYDLYVISNTAPTSGSYYTEITVNSENFFYNPDFACEVFEKKDGVDIPPVPQAKKDAEGKPIGTASSTTDGVVIRTARQLANLVTYTTDTGTLGTAAKSWKYHQFLDIDYSQYTGAAEAGSTGTFTTGKSGTPQTPALLSGGSYDGNNFKIVNLYLGTSTSGADTVSSLFATVKNDPAADTPALWNITLVNVKTDDTAAVAAGLVANLTNATVSNCGIYVDNALKAATVTDDAYTTFTVTGTDIAGGLVGKVEGTSVLTSSFAAVQVTGGTTAGGLVGQFTGNATVTDCYAGGHTVSGAYDKAAPNVTGTTVGGFAGEIDASAAVTFTGINYSTCSVGTTATTATMGLFIGTNSGTVTPPTTGAIYATGTAFNADGTQATAADESDYLTTGNAIPRGTLTTTQTHPYDDTLAPLAYPYATNLDEHHGDWVTFPMAAYIEKYQIGTTPEYGAYAASVDATNKVEVTLNTLKSKEALGTGYVVDDFYRILSPQQLPGTTTVTIDSTGTGTLELDKDNFGPDGKKEFDGQTYYVYKITGWTPTITADYYHTLTLGSYTFYINPDFGLEAYAAATNATALTVPFSKPEAAGKTGNMVVNLDANSTTNIATGVVIRSARQLANMQAYTNNADTTIREAAQKWTYDQLLNVDFDPITGYTGAGLTLGKTDTTRLGPAKLSSGTYNGHDNTISNLYLGAGASANDFAGLFGSVAGGTVSHVLLVDVDVKGGDTTASVTAQAVGGLIGQLNGGTVDSCGIYVSKADNYTTRTVTGSGENGVGGLIGQIYNSGESTVKNSFAAVKVQGTAATGTTSPVNSAGGLIGQINVTSATIENCYVGGFVDATDKNYDKAPVNVSGNNNVGGFVGSISTGTVTFTGTNYSTASVGGPDEAKLGLFAGAGNINKPAGTGDKLYAVAKAFKTDTTTTVVAPRDEGTYLVDPEIDTSASLTKDHYNMDGEAYPYPVADGQNTHHGDWILVKATGLYYDTVNSAPSTGYYASGKTISGNGYIGLITGAAPGTTVATDDGYVFLTTTDMGPLAINVGGQSYTLEKEDISSSPLKVNNIEYNYKYKVPAPALNVVTNHYYTVVSLAGRMFTVNFSFAGEIFDGESDDLDNIREKTDFINNEDYTGVVIRSARQLANLGIRSNAGTDCMEMLRGLVYNQLLNIDFEKYTGKDAGGNKKLPEIKDAAGSTDYNHVPITLNGADALYDGHEYTVRNMLPGALVDGEFAENGMFGSVKDGATLQNIVLVNARVVTNGADNGVMSAPTTSTGTTPAEPKAPEILEVGNLDKGSFWTDISDNPKFALLPKETDTTKSNTSSVEEASLSWKNSAGETVYTSTKVLKFGGTSSTTKNSVKFNVDTVPATLKVWWGVGSAEDKRQIQIIGPGSSDKKASEIKGLAVDVPYFTVFEITQKGTYYLGCADSANFIYRVELYEEEVPYSESDPRPYDSVNNKYPFPEAGSGAEGTAIPSDAKVRAGALAGIVDGSTVINCGAYIEYEVRDYDSEGNPLYYTYKDDGTKLTDGTGKTAYDYFLVKNGYSTSKEDYVGGLIGNVAGAKIERSYSAVKVLGVQTAGGFAGQLGGTTTVADSYVGGHTLNGTYYEGENKPLKNVTTSDKSKPTSTGGFAGKSAETVTFSGVVYTTASVGMAEDENNNVSSTIGSFIGNGIEPKTDGDTTLYATGTMFRGNTGIDAGQEVSVTVSGKSQKVKFGQAENYLDETVTMRGDNVGAKSDAYDEALITMADSDYPYLVANDKDTTGAKQKIHHGDWPVRVNFVYYELYKDDPSNSEITALPEPTGYSEHIGVYGVFATADPDKPLVVNTLINEGYVYESGYMITAPIEMEFVDFRAVSRYTKEGVDTYSWTSAVVELEDLGLGGSGGPLGDNGNYCYLIPAKQLNKAPSDDYYMRAYVNGGLYLINPHFACEILNVTEVKKDSSGKYNLDLTNVREKVGINYYDEDGKLWENQTIDGVIIRSAWNFAAIARYSRSSNNGKVKDIIGQQNFYQMLDIDYTKYKEGGIYDGNDNNRIKEGGENKDMTGSSFIYGNVPIILNGGTYEGYNHTISNVYLSNDSGTDNYCVGLFGTLTNGSTVKNLTAENIYLTTGSSNDSNPIYMGVIAASVDEGSTIENVHVKNATFDLHRVPTLKETKDGSGNKKYEWTYDSTPANVSAIGGIVGQLINGSVIDSSVDVISIDLDSGKYYYLGTNGTDENTARSSLKEYTESTKPSGAHKATSVIKDDASISIGGAIGEIKASTSGASVSVTNVEVKEPNIQANKGKTLKVGGAIGDIDTSESTGATAKIDKVYVTDAVVKASSGSDNYVGGVIGRADGKADGADYDATARNAIQISDSGVYLTDAVETDSAVPTKVITDNFNTKYVVSDNTTGDFVGGFVGRTDNYVTVTNSFSAIRVDGKGSVGGFAGHIEGSWIENCFSGGHTTDGTYGTTANVTGGSGSTGGFAGKIENAGSLKLMGTIYTTSSVSGTGTGSVGLFQSGASNRDTIGNVITRNGAIVYATGKPIPSSGTVLDESAYLKTGANVPGSDPALVTNKYDPTLDSSYPYANNTTVTVDGTESLAHYGDWEKYSANAAFYWELEDGEYHFYAVLFDSNKEVTEANSLCAERDAQRIDAWGYGVFSSNESLTFSLPAGLTEDTSDAAKAAMTAVMGAEGFGTAKNVVMISPTTTNTVYEVTVDTDTNFYINPAYAKAVEVKETGAAGSTMGTDTKPYEIRTVQQLKNIGDSNTSSFKQSHDVVFATGDSYTSITSFQGNYDGGEYRILDITAPVFNELANGASIHNVIVYAPEGYDSVTFTGQGGIANKSSGVNVTISDTIVAGFTIGEGDNAGGLVGSVTGGTLTIENCEATNKLNGHNSGGLVGSVGSGGTLTITNSYAGGTITSSANTSAGGLVGAAENSDNVTYKNVYSYMDMTAITSSSTTFYGIGPGTVDPSSELQEYWRDGLKGKTAKDTDANITAVAVAQLKLDTQKHGCSVEEFVVPDSSDRAEGLKNKVEGLTDDADKFAQFPFAAFATGADGRNYHYGAFPAEMKYAGLFYWEKEVVNGVESYHYYAYGGEINGTTLSAQKLLDTLCYDHHLNGERASITDYGYGVFCTAGAEALIELKQSGTAITLSGLPELSDPTVISDLQALPGFSDATVKALPNGTSTNAVDKWTLGAKGTTGDSIQVYPMFGAAIAKNIGSGGMGGEGKDMPLQIRTIQQLQNLGSATTSTDIPEFAITHDIDGKDFVFTPISNGLKKFNGNGYRILDLDITPSNGDAALFSTITDNCVIENVILYSTDGKGVITSTDGNAAGIVATGNNKKVQIENCVVAGYTIKGGSGKSIGGIVGDGSGGGNESYIKNCQAIVTLDGTGGATNIGGIAGTFRGNSSNGIIDCYAGGSVVKATSATVGGIAGGTDNYNLSITKSYSYMNLLDTGASSGKVYAIVGDSNNKATVTDSYYLKDYLPTGAVTTNQGTAMTFAQMCGEQDTNIADYVYVPNATDPMDGLTSWGAGAYPFASTVTVDVKAGVDKGVNTGTIKVHYGDWPYSARAAGIAYWEKVGGKYFFDVVWVDHKGDVQKVNDLCTEHHVDASGNIEEHKIEDSGYVFFTTNKDLTLGELLKTNGFGLTKKEETVDITSTLVTGGTDRSAVIDALNEKLKVKCIEAFTVVSSNGKFTKEKPGTVDAYRTVTLTKIDGTTVEQRLYCNPGMSGVAEKQFRDEYNVDASGKEELVAKNGVDIEIRTVKQLDNIPDKVSAGFHFKQTHDLYGKDYGNASNPKYTGADEFAGTYDGQGYKILDLSMSGAKKDVGLFASINANTCELRNIIMYAPNGATISGTGTTGNDATDDHYGVGGLVGSIGSGSSETAKIENCVVAGYTIKGEQYVGGLIGWGFHGADIKNCVAVNDIECTTIAATTNNANGADNCGAGGILGGYGSNSTKQTSITNCYTGGTIKVSGDNETSAVVGGICGKNGNTSDHAKVTNCYTYVDLSNCASAKVSVISSTENSNNANNYYLNDSARIPNWVHKQGEGKTYNELNGVFSGADFGTATESYVSTGKPAGSTSSGDGEMKLSDNFPFPEVVRKVKADGTYDGFVHYGEWPANGSTPSSSSYPWTDGEIGVILGYSSDNTFGTDSDVVAMMFSNNGTSSVRGTTTGTAIDKYIGLVIGNVTASHETELKNSLKVLFFNTDSSSSYEFDGSVLKIKATPTSFYQYTGNNGVTSFKNSSDFIGYTLYGAATDTEIENDAGLLLIVYDSAVTKDTKNITFSKENIVGYVKVEDLNKAKTTGTAGSPATPEGPSFEAAALPEMFRLPEVEEHADPDADGHVKVVRRRTQAVSVRRRTRRAQEI